MSNTCSTCSHCRVLDGVRRCCFILPQQTRPYEDPAPDNRQFKRVFADGWCAQHSDEVQTTQVQEPLTTTTTNGLRANLGSLTPIAGVLTIPALTGVRALDYYRVLAAGTLFGVARAAGDLVVALIDDADESTSGNWSVQ